MCFDVEIDAQAVGHKAQHQDRSDPDRRGQTLAQDQGHQQTAKAGENALDGGDLDRGAAAEQPGTVVLQTPAAGGGQHEGGAGAEAQTLRTLKAQDDAGAGHLHDGSCQPPGELLPEQEQRDQGGGHDLEIVQQGSVGGAGPLQTQHQQNGRGDVQQDHAQHIGVFRPGDGAGFGVRHEPAPEEQSRACAQIQECRHHGRLRVGEQQLAHRRVDGIQRRCQNCKKCG